MYKKVLCFNFCPRSALLSQESEQATRAWSCEKYRMRVTALSKKGEKGKYFYFTDARARREEYRRKPSEDHQLGCLRRGVLHLPRYKWKGSDPERGHPSRRFVENQAW